MLFELQKEIIENYGNADVYHHDDDGRDDDDNFGTQAILLLCAAVSVSAELLVGFTQPFYTRHFHLISLSSFHSAIFGHFHSIIFTRSLSFGHFSLDHFHSAMFYLPFSL